MIFGDSSSYIVSMIEFNHVTEVTQWKRPEFSQTTKGVIDACQLGMVEAGLAEFARPMPLGYWEAFFNEGKTPQKLSSKNHVLMVYPSRYSPVPSKKNTVLWRKTEPRVILEMVVLPSQSEVLAEASMIRVLRLINNNFEGVLVDVPNGVITFPKDHFATVSYEEKVPDDIPDALLREWQ